MKVDIDDCFAIFVLPPNLDETSMEYSDAIRWAFDNINSDYVLKVTLEDIYLLSQKALDFVNDANDSMIGPFEDDWIFSQEVKNTVLKKLRKYFLQLPNGREKSLLGEINRLIQKSIEIEHHIYFKF